MQMSTRATPAPSLAPNSTRNQRVVIGLGTLALMTSVQALIAFGRHML
jgi:hypothetical protein